MLQPPHPLLHAWGSRISRACFYSGARLPALADLGCGLTVGHERQGLVADQAVRGCSGKSRTRLVPQDLHTCVQSPQSFEDACHSRQSSMWRQWASVWTNRYETCQADDSEGLFSIAHAFRFCPRDIQFYVNCTISRKKQLPLSYTFCAMSQNLIADLDLGVTKVSDYTAFQPHQ